MSESIKTLPVVGQSAPSEPGECGLGHACSFCPRESSCRLDKDRHDRALVTSRLDGIGAVVAVMANKGGVGKSTVAANLAVALARKGLRVGLGDADVHGPNSPKLFGLSGERVKVRRNGITPVRYESADRLAKIPVASLGFFLPESDTPIVWRDPYKFDYVHHLVGSHDWGSLDVLAIDMPPGTGNELITLCDVLEGRPFSAMLVSAADALSLEDSLKAARFCRERGVPVLGLVENLAGLTCPHCGGAVELAPRDPSVDCFQQEGIETLAQIPFHPAISGAVADGHPIVGLDPANDASNAFLDLAGRVIEFGSQARAVAAPGP